MMGISRYVFCCLLPVMVLSQSFRGVPIDTVVLEGNEVLLNCSFNDFESTATVAWNRGQLSLYLGNKAGKVYADADFNDCCEIVGNTQNDDFMLKIRNANFDDMAIWKCSYSGTIILEEEADITVLEGPPTCEVNGAGPENEVVEGRSDATMSCIADGTPPATLVWMKDGIDTPSNGNSPVDYSPVFSRDDAEVPFSCKISHGTLADAVTCEDVITFDVQYPPDLKIDVEPRYKDGQIKEGEDFFASCNVISSNPRTDNVAWTSLLDNFQVDPNNPLEILSITRDKAGEYMCSAENTYYDGTTGNTEEIITIDVQYIPVVVLDESKTVKEGDAASINCSTFITEANPAASEFQWIRNSAVEQTTEELTMDSVARSDAGLYSCWAFNYFYDGSPGKGESTTELVVQYAPVVTVPSVVARRVGETLTIECEVDSLPAPESIQWVAPGADQPLSQTSTVELVDIGKGEGGIYTCNSQNTFYDGVQGTGSATTTVQIQYGPEVSLESPLQPVTEGTKVTINCTVDSQPPPFKYEWTQIMKDGTVNELGEDMEYLSFASVDRSKGGNYTCKATTKFYDNMDEDASASAELVIHYSPDIVDAVDKVAVDKDEMAVLVCKSDAFPDPQFKWLNSSGGELTSDVEGLQIAEKYEDNLFISTLTIKKVNSAKDYGRYDCMAYNEIGTKSLQIELVPITIPEKPTITETSVSDTTIAVTWTSGFNGGRPQTFTVKYQNLETLDEAKSTEMKDDGSESYTYTIEGLKADTEYAVWVLATNTKGEQEVKSSALKTDKAADMAPQKGSSNVGAIIGALIVVLIVIIVVVVLVIFLMRRRKQKAAQKGGSDVSPKKLDEEEVPLNDKKEEEKGDQGVSEYALDDETGDKKKPEEEKLLKPDEDEKKDEEKEAPASPPHDEPPFMKNGMPAENENEKEDKGTEKEEEPEAETKIDDPPTDNKDDDTKGPRKNEVVYAQLDMAKPKDDKPVKEPSTEYADIDFARSGQPTAL